MGDVARKAVGSFGIAPGDGRALEWLRSALRCARHLCPPRVANAYHEALMMGALHTDELMGAVVKSRFGASD